MSTQDESGIAFSLLPEEGQQHFRLLELPPELLSLLTSDSPPILQFKSQDGPPSDAGNNAVICTNVKTFNLRQVNTSNSVYLTQPKDVNVNDDRPSPPGLQAIAESDSTLELLPVPPHPNNAKSQIRAMLPTYSSTGHYQAKELTAKEQLFANIPFSEGECQAAFDYMACFQTENPMGCFVPSGQAKVQAWKSITQEAAAQDLDLTSALSVPQAIDIIDTTVDWPTALTKAVQYAIFIPNPLGTSAVTIDEIHCITFVGLSQLEASTQGLGATGKAGFMAAWRDLLPEKWRSKVSLELLRNQYVLENDGRDIALAGSTAEARSAPGMAVPAAGTKRKWHDKFRASKKTT
ncbi:hypothetical protein LTR36_004327 [Oleoguttula mirabilis]|uniref:Sister chromatid cohesion protein DCC1 n=1 Tax=Oleoguttula mirabilis TaxID=1507867 RepID=A0AAV9JGX6_9PEZI|nr:hypothetical protein LTR36_004327 [Oleoguttula mirabilis]